MGNILGKFPDLRAVYTKGFTDRKGAIVDALVATGKYTLEQALNLADTIIPVAADIAATGVVVGVAAAGPIAVAAQPEGPGEIIGVVAELADLGLGAILPQIANEVKIANSAVINEVRNKISSEKYPQSNIVTAGNSDMSSESISPKLFVHDVTTGGYYGKAARDYFGSYAMALPAAISAGCDTCVGSSNGISDNIDQHDQLPGCNTCGKFVGSAEVDIKTVRDYVNSTNALTKDRIVDEIITALESLGFKVSASDRAKKIEEILKIIPDGKRFSQSDEAHKRVCVKIADAINNVHGSKVIDKSQSPERICQQVVEIVSSIAAGVHTEFVAIAAEVQKVLKNLYINLDVFKEILESEKGKIANADDPEFRDSVAIELDLFNTNINETERQIAMLKNLIDVKMTPTERDLADLLRKSKDTFGYIESSEAKPGKESFSKMISDTLKGLNITAALIEVVNKALKEVGITLDEYSKARSLTEIQGKVANGAIKLADQPEKLRKYLDAADFLYKNFYRNNDIATYIQTHSMKGANEAMSAAYSADGAYGSDVSGSAEPRYPKTHVDKRVEDRRHVRNLIFNAFYRQVAEIFKNMVGSLDVISKKVGSEIPISDQLDGFRHIIQRMREELVENKQVYYALIGYFNDALSKQKRETLLGELHMISSYIDTILEMDMYKSSAHYFREFQGSIKQLVSLIEKDSEEFAAKFGRGEVSGSGDDVDVMDCKFLEEKSGSAEQKGLFAEPQQVKRSTKSLQDAFRQFDYYFRVAQIKSNLASTGKELEHYAERYEKLVSSSVASKMQDAKDKYDVVREFIIKTRY